MALYSSNFLDLLWESWAIIGNHMKPCLGSFLPWLHRLVFALQLKTWWVYDICLVILQNWAFTQQAWWYPNRVEWKFEQRSLRRQQVMSSAMCNKHVCHCFGPGCLATVTAVNHERNMRPNPIRSGYYWGTRWRGSNGAKEDREGDTERQDEKSGKLKGKNQERLTEEDD